MTTIRRDLRPSGEESGRSVSGGTSSRRIRRALVVAEFALAHLRSQLLSGEYVVVQDDEGCTFIGTPQEAAQHMMEGAGGVAH